MKTMKGTICFVAFVCLVASCNHPHPKRNKKKYIARVGSSYLSLKEAKKNISYSAYTQDSAYAIRQYRKRWIQQQILLHEAKKMHLANNTDIKNKLKEARDEVLLNALKRLIISKYSAQHAVSDSEAVQYYQQNKNKLKLNERYVKFRHVETHNLRLARRARHLIVEDSSWKKVANQYSLQAAKNINESKSYWPVSSVFNEVPMMKRYVSRLDSGQVSPIQRERGIYHFVEITGVREQGASANAKWFTGQLASWLMYNHQINYYESYVKNLYLSAKKDNEIELYNVNNILNKQNIDSTNQTNE